MKALFLVFHGFLAYNGISKKIGYQVDGLRQCGIDTRLTYLKIDDNNIHYRMADETVIENYGKGFQAKIRKRICYRSLYNYVRNENIEFIYLRYDHNANPLLILFLKSLQKLRVKVFMEIPTYPYDKEYKGLSLDYQRILFFDKCFRERMAKYVDYIVTFSDHKEIWNRPTIQISNGIDFSQIKIKQNNNINPNLINFIGVATIHPWHGYDRLIKGLIEYYKQNAIADKVYFHIVGEGVPEIMNYYKELAQQNNLEDYIIFHGPKFGTDLDNLFELADLGIGSLARHRSGIDKIKTLKNREYAARGIPFIYSEFDEDFENMPYIYKVPADDSAININELIRFYKTNHFEPNAIRASIENSLSWKKQMQHIVNLLF